MNSNIFFLISGWFVYFALHSILASKKVKKQLQKYVPEKNYRLVYNLISVVFLVPIFYIHLILHTSLVFSKNTWINFFGLVSAAYGVIIMRLAFKNYDLKEFLGLETNRREPKFIVSGISKKVRHPLYLGLILLVAGYFLFSPRWENLISATCIIIYILVGIQFEEKKLLEEFGKNYEKYKNEVPMLIPRF